MFSHLDGAFLTTTGAQFLSRFFSVAMLKGHIQGNKGFQFAALPRFDDSFVWKWNKAEAVRKALVPNRRGARGARSIPIALRQQILERDGGRCKLCGHGPMDGVTLHVDP
jgi:hypothetical protein